MKKVLQVSKKKKFWDYITDNPDNRLTYYKEYCLELSREGIQADKIKYFLEFLLKLEWDQESKRRCIGIFLDFCGEKELKELQFAKELLGIALDLRDYKSYCRILLLDFEILTLELENAFRYHHHVSQNVGVGECLDLMPNNSLLKEVSPVEEISNQSYTQYFAGFWVSVVDSFAKARKLDFFISSFMENQTLDVRSMSFLLNHKVLEVLAEHIAKYTSAISARLLEACMRFLYQALEKEQLSKISSISILILIIARHIRLSDGVQGSVVDSCVFFHSEIILPLFQKGALSEVDSDILSVWHGLMEAFHSYSQDHVNSELILKFLALEVQKTDSNFQLLKFWQTKIALSHVDRIASTVQDPVKVYELTQIVSKLKLLMKLKNIDDEAHVISLLDHLTVICRLGTAEMVKSVAKYIVKIMQKKSTICNALFKSAVFYEIMQIRDCILEIWFQQMDKELKKIYSSSKSAKSLQKLFLEAMNDSIKFCEKSTYLFEKKGCDTEQTFQEDCCFSGVLKLLECLDFFPTYYFNNAEEKKIVSVMILLDRFGFMISDIQTHIAWIFQTRSLLSKHVKMCQHHNLLSLSSDYLIYLLDSLVSIDLVEDVKQVNHIKWETISVLEEIVVKLCLPKLKASFVMTLIDHRNVLACDLTSKTIYFDYGLMSILFKLACKKGANQGIVSQSNIEELTISVIENVLSGSFDSEIELLVVNEALKLQEKYGLSVILISCTQKLEFKYAAVPVGSPPWLLTFGILCHWIKYLPQSVFMELLESGWVNIGHSSVREGFGRIIQLADNKQSLFMAQNVLDKISSIVRNFKITREGTIPSDYAIKFLKVFFDMDILNGIFLVIKLLAGARTILKQLSEILHSLVVICALSSNYQSIIEVLDFCHCLIINKKLVLSPIQICKMMEIISAIGESSICLNSVEQKSELFHHIYLVANDIVRYQREALVQVIPHFISILQDLLKCFQDSPAAYRYRTQDTRQRSRFEILCQDSAPLPPKLASLYTNIIMSMTQKPSRDLSDETLLNSQSSLYIKPFSKHAPFLLIEFITIQASKRSFQAAATQQLTNGMYSLLNLCSRHGNDFILATLDPHTNARPLFKKLVSEWEADHKFNGL